MNMGGDEALTSEKIILLICWRVTLIVVCIHHILDTNEPKVIVNLISVLTSLLPSSRILTKMI